ncbi:MAG: hypothetical protein GY765_19905 [bacterium]|nr:hypothetical protein [bacterium]
MTRMRFQIIIFILLSPFLWAEESNLVHELHNICLVLEDHSPVYADHRDQAQITGHVNMGEVFIVLNVYTINDREAFYEIFPPSGKTAWIKNTHCNLMDVGFVNGCGKNDLYPVFDTAGKGKIIAKKKKKNRFCLKTWMLPGKPSVFVKKFI